MAETMNMMNISVEMFCNEVKMDLEDENYDPMIGIGKSGVGKTMSIYELTQELGIGFCELRLVTLTEVDLLGIPDTVVDSEGNKRTTYASNDLLPDAKRDGESGILVLDEITSATSTIRAAAYQLLDSKRALGNYKLPPKWKVVALGNGMDDGGVFSGMESAFLSRASCYRIEPDVDTWKKWAVKNGVNKSVIAYMSFDPKMMHQMDPDEPASIFPCPRSWTALSKKLNAREARNGGEPLPQEQVEIYAAGAVGMEAASSFSAFYAYNKETISPEDIMSGKASGADLNEDSDAQVVYLVIQSLIAAVQKDLTANHIDYGEFKSDCVDRMINVANWLMAIPKLDYAITCMQDLSKNVKLFAELILSCDDFDDKCPELATYASKQNIVFKP